MLRTGVDLVEIERVRRVMARSGERFLARIFTPQEQAYCQGRIASLAGRFAVKEAVAKALGTGIGDVTWVEIEIVSDKMGRPELVLHGAAKEAADALGLVDGTVCDWFCRSCGQKFNLNWREM
ncbi:MAG: holo-ACP synthase [Anaerolineae bacterium]